MRDARENEDLLKIVEARRAKGRWLTETDSDETHTTGDGDGNSTARH